MNKISRFFKLLYRKLVKINDTPQRIALGLGLGVTLGIIPGTGPLAALFLAFILKVNRASALLGSLLTNTWLSFATFALAIKSGSFVLRLSLEEVYRDWNSFLKDFHWVKLFKLSLLKLILPVLVGYIIVAFCLGFAVYLITLIILGLKRYEIKKAGGTK